MWWKLAAVGLAAIALTGCAMSRRLDRSRIEDASRRDAGAASDSGPPDTGPPDSGPPDTGPPDSGRDAGPCPGSVVGGHCWLASRVWQGCGDRCREAGLTYSEATRTYAGSNGTDANCGAVLDALGIGLDHGWAGRLCAAPYGCCGPFRMRCADMPTTEDGAGSGVIRACACH